MTDYFYSFYSHHQWRVFNSAMSSFCTLLFAYGRPGGEGLLYLNLIQERVFPNTVHFQIWVLSCLTAEVQSVAAVLPSSSWFFSLVKAPSVAFVHKVFHCLAHPIQMDCHISSHNGWYSLRLWFLSFLALDESPPVHISIHLSTASSTQLQASWSAPAC